MKKIVSLLLILVILLPSFMLSACSTGKKKFTKYYYDYFDTATQVIVYCDSQGEFDSLIEKIESELSYYHKLFDIYDIYGGINNAAYLNENAAKSQVKVEKELTEFLLYCKDAYDISKGKVNAAMGSVLEIWHEYREAAISDPQNASLPSKNELIEASLHTDINSLVINKEENTVFYSDPLLKIDLGAVAKGYTAEKIYGLVKELGYDDFLLNLGGNIKASGFTDGKKWTAGIENPDKLSIESIIEYIELSDMALVTSGSYQRYYVYEGKRYNHIIDNKSLFPADLFLSVSVITDDSALGDLLSTALFTMSIEDGKALLKEFPGCEAMWVNFDGSKVYSEGFKNYIK